MFAEGGEFGAGGACAGVEGVAQAGGFAAGLGGVGFDGGELLAEGVDGGGFVLGVGFAVGEAVAQVDDFGAFGSLAGAQRVEFGGGLFAFGGALAQRHDLRCGRVELASQP